MIVFIVGFQILFVGKVGNNSRVAAGIVTVNAVGEQQLQKSVLDAVVYI